MSSNENPNPLNMHKEDDTVIIVVMGATGVGKSSFIRLITGREDIKIGQTLFSETKEVRGYNFCHKGKNYVLVDTPGLDDSFRSDTQVAGLILTWLRDSMALGQQLNGVIYLHRITDTRMGGTALRNTRMFSKLVGKDAFKNVILATTFWEQVPVKDGVRREIELRETPDFWGDMLDHGAKIVRLRNEQRAGLRLLERFSGKGKAVLEAQQVMANEAKPIVDTEAMRELWNPITAFEQDLEEQRRAENRRYEEEIERLKRRQQEQVKKQKEEFEQRLEAERKVEQDQRAQKEKEELERYEREKEELEAEQQRQEERRRREVEHLQEERKLEQKRKKRLKDKYHRQRICIGYEPRGRGRCAKCHGNLKRWDYYYHCCFCDFDKYFSCEACGPRCRNSSHPSLKKIQIPYHECVLM